MQKISEPDNTDEDILYYTCQLVQILPVVLRHETECTEHCVTKVVKVGVPLIRIFAAWVTHVILRTTERVTKYDITSRIHKRKFG